VVDTRALLTGLEDYLASLNRHIEDLRAEYAHLEMMWRRFASVYDGEAADQFKEGWARTAQRFRDYIDQTDGIKVVLEGRIEALREVNRRDSVLS
jgi:uncharacterized protein YukE